jgi:hypothetical protein
MHVVVRYYKPHFSVQRTQRNVKSSEINNKAMELNLNSIAKISSICCENVHGDRLNHTTPPFYWWLILLLLQQRPMSNPMCSICWLWCYSFSIPFAHNHQDSFLQCSRFFIFHVIIYLSFILMWAKLTWDKPKHMLLFLWIRQMGRKLNKTWCIHQHQWCELTRIPR